MIYIISEDNFFTLGLIASLKTAELNAIHISLYEFGRIKEQLKDNDIVLGCIQSRENSLLLSKLAQHVECKVIHFIDTVFEKNIIETYRKKLISKKVDKVELISTIKFFEVRDCLRPVTFSKSETTIMDLLTQQKDAFRISKLMGISPKTVFAHKLNALKKMGFNHLNSRSILIYESVFKAG